MATTTTDTEYLYPSTWTNLTDKASNYAAGFPAWLNQVYSNWYGGGTQYAEPFTASTSAPDDSIKYATPTNQYALSTGITPELQAAYQTMSSQPSQQWIGGIQGAQTTAAGAQPYFQQAADALSPWQSTIGACMTALGSTVGAVNPYLSGMNQYQQYGQEAMGGYNQAMGTLGGTMGQVNPYLAGVDVNQQNLLNQMGGYGAAQNYLGQTTGAINPYMTAIGGYQQGATGAAQQGATAAQNYLQQAMSGVSPYMTSADILQQQAQGYTGQIGGGQAGVQAGIQALAGASPYLQQAAGQYAQGAEYNPEELQQYLNPYTQQAAQATVSDLTRNLQEKILPEVNTSFTGAGQFGSSRNAEFEARAIRDTQEAAAKALAQANYGAYNQAQQAYSDWANKQMASGQGLAGLAGQQTNIGQAYGQLGGQQAQIASQQVSSALQNAGLDQTQAQMVGQLMPQLAQVQNQITNQTVTTAMQNAGLSQNQAQLVAQMYPQLAQMQGTLTQNQIQGYLQNAGLDQTQAALVAQTLPSIAQQQASVTNQTVSNYLQQAGLDQNQAQLVAQMYPQLAAGYGSLGQQYGALSGAYGTLGTQQGNLASILGSLAGQGAALTQADIQNMMTAATSGQQIQQAALDKAYQDFLTQQQYPLSGLSAISTAIGNMAKGVTPNVSTPVAQPDDVSRVLAAIQAASSGLSDTSIQNVLQYLFPSGDFTLG